MHISEKAVLAKVEEVIFRVQPALSFLANLQELSLEFEMCFESEKSTHTEPNSIKQ